MVQQKLIFSDKIENEDEIHQKEKLVPKIRFSEFNDNWNIIKIENNAIIKGRIGWKNLKSEEYTDEGPFLIAGKHISNGIINWKECDHITHERYDESPEIALKNGDIIFSKDGSLGNPALIKNLGFEATINGTMMLVRLNQKKINPNYFYQVLNSDYFFRLLHLLKSGSSIPHIFQRDMINFKFPICSIKEQKKIANFLEKIDEKIELLKKEYQYYENYKKYFMQQIFLGNLRFKDNNGENFKNWEKVRLKEVNIKISDGNYGEAYPKEKDFKNEGVPFIRSVNIQNSKLTFEDMRYISQSLHNTLLQGHLKENDILITTRGDIGLVAYVTNDFANSNINAQICLLRVFDKNIHPKYLFYFLTTSFLQKQLLKYQTGSALKQLPKNSLKDLKLLIPQYEEQIKIVDFLVELDKKMDLIEEKIHETMKFKKSLLQQMFV